MNKIWFKAKRYGWGWQPSTWEGWLVLAIYVAGAINYSILVDQGSHRGSDTLIGGAPFFIIWTALLLAVCYWKGEKPSWRWGEKL
ncbi:MAG: hypothetical protein V4674_01465 [Patescibacteria group bacterium]